ncbi:MAG: cytochrome o ubiquinol oxidase subunit II [Parcubacteria group bacterium Gr01-1014_56]|nr:MAG: cytochrome o ubiquinol oxidase subunit II [Parcubacteria group bacterium Gr01-1014_56]
MWLPDIALLNPKGAVGLSELGLMIHAVEFMLIVALPVYFLVFFFAWRYRAGNTKAAYSPNWEHAKVDELIWWAIPFEIVLILGALTWSSTHELDPRAPLEGGAPLVVEVVALDWKWLFIYPEQNIATVNYIAVPVDRPVRFDVTADAPMNSFWIPRLGGQIYAMTGMVNSLNLVANEPGTYEGVSANYSGIGFAKMKFVVKALPQEEFDSWVISVKASSKILTHEEYALLALPSIANEPAHYAEVEQNLYNMIVAQFTERALHSAHE